MIVISSKDQKLLKIEFLQNSGGLFRDMMIHDLDMARWIIDDEFEEIYVTGSCLVSKKLETFGDVYTQA